MDTPKKHYSLQSIDMDSAAAESMAMDEDHGNDHRNDDRGRSFLPPGFETMEEYLSTLQTFLCQCEPITNLMIVDYFTTNSWETKMPQEWRDAFESPRGKLSSLDLMELVSLGTLRDYNKQPGHAADQGTTGAASNTYNSQDWPESLKEFIQMIKKLSINRTLDPDYAKFKDTLDIHLIPGMSPKKLHEVEILSGLMASYSKEHGIGSVIDLGAGQGYLSRVLAFQHQLCVLGVDSNTIQTCGAQTTQKRTEKLFVNKSRNKQNAARKTKAQRQAKAKAKEGQGPKEGTETQLTQVQKPPQTTEGQEHTLPDSEPPTSIVPQDTPISEVATDATTSRTIPPCPLSAATCPLPSTLLSKPKPKQSASTSKPEEEDAACQKISKKFKTEAGSSASGSDSGQGGIPNKRLNSNTKKKRTKKPSATNNNNSNNKKVEESNTLATIADSTTSAAKPTSDTPMDDDSPVNNPQLSHKMDVTTKIPMDSSNDPQMAQTPGSNFQLQHITHTITAATLPTLLKEHFPKIAKYAATLTSAASSIQDSEQNNKDHSDRNGDEHGQHHDDHSSSGEDDVGRWTLCGLHACGDLTSNMIKLYLESSATCLFSVGCCYHWITERFDKDGQVVLEDGTHGFPLSRVFNARKAHLGDHAKMIACQSPERWLKYQKESEDAIHGHYFRALLHKLMVEKDLYPGPPAIAPVLGRMGKHRLKGFPHYLAMALQRLKLPAEAITFEEAQQAYDTYLERDLYRIGILWALRTMLGPLFEGMILLDRAMHLHETILSRPSRHDGTGKRKGMASVQLVAGFDVVESPRNMILIALKD
ncbi:Methyltransferase-like protein 25 [Podila humilis]|nr:Methyltransferase-like protein 25 [Podila humilis]